MRPGRAEDAAPVAIQPAIAEAAAGAQRRRQRPGRPPIFLIYEPIVNVPAEIRLALLEELPRYTV